MRELRNKSDCLTHLVNGRYWKSIFEQLRDIGLLKILFSYHGAFFPEQLSPDKTSPFFAKWDKMYAQSSSEKVFSML